MRRNRVEQADDAESDIERLIRPNGIRLGQPQLRRLAWLVRRFGAPIVWENGARPTAGGGLIIVIDPPNGASAELLCRSLHGGSVVAIPFGENPGFDFLKSKLTDFGTIGACGIGYPHELWWGGLEWTMPKPDRAAIEKTPRVVSCYPRGLGETHVRRLKRSLARLELDFDIEPIDAVFDDRMFGFEKADFVARMWDRHGGPLLFVEADAVLHELPILPARLGCDFAAHRWNRWEMSARTIYFGGSSIAETLLRTWQDLAATYPSVWDGYLLDQAWSLTSSQMPLDTVWLPRSYHALTGDVDAQRPATIVHDLATAARRPHRCTGRAARCQFASSVEERGHRHLARYRSKRRARDRRQHRGRDRCFRRGLRRLRPARTLAMPVEGRRSRRQGSGAQGKQPRHRDRALAGIVRRSVPLIRTI